MLRKITAVIFVASFGIASIHGSAQAVFLDAQQRACITKKYGAKAAAAIVSAKKLTAAQIKQVKACPVTSSAGSSGGTGSTGSAGSSGGTGSTGGAGSSSLTPLTWGLMWSAGSNQSGLGNVSDPALLRLADGTLRMFFKNGNEPQIPISGFDNKIHSYVSSDDGASWTLESGVRIDVGSPVTVRVAEAGGYEAWGWAPGSGGVDRMVRFTSTTGRDFTSGSGSLVPTTSCKNADGKSAGFLGDPQVEKVAGGYLAYAHDLAAGQSPPFKRQACKITSSDGTNWTIDSGGTFALSHDIQTNPELYRNSSGQLELWFPSDKGGIKTTEIRTSTNDGVTWSAATTLSWIAPDPDRLDLPNGTSLLAFGGFDSRIGGLLAVSKKIAGTYSASRDEKVDQVTWVVSGATRSEIKVKNLCRGRDETANATFGTSGSNVTVTFKDSTVGCAFIVVGASQALS
ncbi:MAG: hypothetical protein EBQ57_01365 [Actinobacteria bacterium]|nr:hypothetical protein [Actinomycetota bacterium]